MMVEIEMEIDEIEKVEIQPAKLKQELNNNGNFTSNIYT